MNRFGTTYPLGLATVVCLLFTVGAAATALLVESGTAASLEISGEPPDRNGSVSAAEGIRPSAASPRIGRLPPLPAATGGLPNLEDPPARPDPVEQARSFAWSGDPGRAARKLGELFASVPADAELRLEAARYHWWAGEAREAEALASEVAAVDGSNGEAEAFLAEVRRSLTPSVEEARSWLAESGKEPEAHLRLARAYVRDEDHGASLAHFRIALEGSGEAGPLHLELAWAAVSADSLAVAIRSLEDHLRERPGDREAWTFLARVHGWAGEYARALPVYEALLADRDDASLRLERARINAWSGRHEEAAADVEWILGSDPDHAEAHLLGGDLARWQGDWERAGKLYAHVERLNPDLPGLALARAEVARGLQARRFSLVEPEALQVEAMAFGDTESYRTWRSQARGNWRTGWGAVHVEVGQELVGTGVIGGARAPRAVGFGGRLGTEVAAPGGTVFRVSGGVHGFDASGWSPLLDAAVRFPWADGRAEVEYAREPAAHRAARRAALEAGAESERFTVTISRPAASGYLWSRAEAEHLRSSEGQLRRFRGDLSYDRPLTTAVSARFGLSTVATDGASPSLPEGATLYWAPKYYVNPTAGLGFSPELGDHLGLELRVMPGFAFTRERAGYGDRFPHRRTPTLGFGIDAVYSRSWELRASVGSFGALDGGYRATNLQIQAGHPLGNP